MQLHEISKLFMHIQLFKIGTLFVLLKLTGYSLFICISVSCGWLADDVFDKDEVNFVVQVL